MSTENTFSSVEDTSISVSPTDHRIPVQGTSDAEPIPLFTGACFCGAIKFTLSSLPIKSYLCHCLNCRRMTGTSFAHNIAFPFSSLTVSTRPGEGQNSDTLTATANTGNVLSTFGDLETGRRQFCRDCGTGLFFFGKVPPGEKSERVIVQAGVIDGSNEDERLRPVEEGFCKRREDWMPDMKGTKLFEEWR